MLQFLRGRRAGRREVEGNISQRKIIIRKKKTKVEHFYNLSKGVIDGQVLICSSPNYYLLYLRELASRKSKWQIGCYLITKLNSNDRKEILSFRMFFYLLANFQQHGFTYSLVNLIFFFSLVSNDRFCCLHENCKNIYHLQRRPRWLLHSVL